MPSKTKYTFAGNIGPPTSEYWNGVQWKLRLGVWTTRVGMRRWYVLPTALICSYPASGNRYVYKYRPGAKAAFLEMILFNQQSKEEE